MPRPSPTDNSFYVFEADNMHKLYNILDGLYGNGTHLTEDERRYLAGSMFVVLNKAIQIKEGDTI